MPIKAHRETTRIGSATDCTGGGASTPDSNSITNSNSTTTASPYLLEQSWLCALVVLSNNPWLYYKIASTLFHFSSE